jgi:hypothetical protein
VNDQPGDRATRELARSDAPASPPPSGQATTRLDPAPVRWSTKGLRGIRLETIRVGSTTCTSLEALQRFFDGLTALDGGHVAPPVPRATNAMRREEARVNKRLDEIGL